MFACIELLPKTVFVEISPPPIPMLIEFTEISFAIFILAFPEISPHDNNPPISWGICAYVNSFAVYNPLALVTTGLSPPNEIKLLDSIVLKLTSLVVLPPLL